MSLTGVGFSKGWVMRIVFVAKHNNGGNDEETAITHALETLGHEVVRLDEYKGAKAAGYRADLMLFLKYNNPDVLRRVNYPKVFWYFDLVTYPDPSLESRNQTRVNWMKEVMPLADLGFCTDGDWVQKCGGKGCKLVWLPQGFDSRTAGVGESWESGKVEQVIDILFTGISKGGGRGRIKFVNELAGRYGDGFHHVTGGVHGTELRRLIRSAKIVVAPDSPVTDKYWSNRVYLTFGYGGFLLHPHCKGITKHYQTGNEIATYHSLEHLHDRISFYLNKPTERNRVAENGMNRTLAEHTYVHRCQQLIATVKGRLGV